MEGYKFKYVKEALFTGTCEICNKSCTECIDVGPYSVICMHCAKEIAETIPKAPVNKKK
jgi:hypothetical protein